MARFVRSRLASASGSAASVSAESCRFAAAFVSAAFGSSLGRCFVAAFGSAAFTSAEVCRYAAALVFAKQKGAAVLIAETAPLPLMGPIGFRPR